MYTSLWNNTIFKNSSEAKIRGIIFRDHTLHIGPILNKILGSFLYCICTELQLSYVISQAHFSNNNVTALHLRFT